MFFFCGRGGVAATGHYVVKKSYQQSATPFGSRYMFPETAKIYEIPINLFYQQNFWLPIRGHIVSIYFHYA
jgi:hypothetical protein